MDNTERSKIFSAATDPRGKKMNTKALNEV